MGKLKMGKGVKKSTPKKEKPSKKKGD